MKIVSVSDFAIHLRLGRAEQVGTPYVNRVGNLKYQTQYKETYKTNAGNISPVEWLGITKQIIQAVGEIELLNEIKEHVRNNCAWLKKEKEIEEYAMECMASEAYMYWDDFKNKRTLKHKIFLFEKGDFYGYL